ncbi:MAG: 4-hydroxythreonine-4-phosphate dehydrogenase PdxA [Candidatus Omnitrophica bacterium]|nr:4-hydroxythreonine-4-phosphate dehydrogenase PdxA [Candidatus Omnitrophota bacterium]
MPISRSNRNKFIAITLGDPGGVGPEVIAKSLNDSKITGLARFIIIGDYSAYSSFAKNIPSGCAFIDTNSLKNAKPAIGSPNRLNARASLDYLDLAIKLLKERSVCGLVTGPVCKESIRDCNNNFVGHTEYLAENFNIKDYGMFFSVDNIRTIVVTRHIPLKDVPKSVTKKKVYIATKLGFNALKGFFGIKRPKIAVCGLNPHAGEGGKIGDEESKVIIPAMQRLKKDGILVDGPFASDTVFTPNVICAYDLVVAMYHDQGLIGLKTMHFNKLVNMTVGLPFIRTSPAHGTAFNIAGKNKVDPASMKEAIRLCATFAK